MFDAFGFGLGLGIALVLLVEAYYIIWIYKTFYKPKRPISKTTLAKCRRDFRDMPMGTVHKLAKEVGKVKEGELEDCAWANIILEGSFQYLLQTNMVQKSMERMIQREFEQAKQLLMGSFLKSVHFTSFDLGSSVPKLQSAKSFPHFDEKVGVSCVLFDVIYEGDFSFTMDIVSTLNLSAVLQVTMEKFSGRMVYACREGAVMEHSFTFMEQPQMNIGISHLIDGVEIPGVKTLLNRALRRHIRDKYVVPHVKVINFDEDAEDDDDTSFDRRRTVGHRWLKHDFRKKAFCEHCSDLITRKGFFCKTCFALVHKKCMEKFDGNMIGCVARIEADDSKKTDSAVNEDVDSCSVFRFCQKGALCVNVVQARDVVGKDATGFSDPFCVVSFARTSKRTKVMWATLQPVWNQNFCFLFLDPKCTVLRVTVFDKDTIGKNDYLGSLVINLATLQRGVTKRETFELQPRSKKEKVGGTLTLELTFSHIPEVTQGVLSHAVDADVIDPKWYQEEDVDVSKEDGDWVDVERPSGLHATGEAALHIKQDEELRSLIQYLKNAVGNMVDTRDNFMVPLFKDNYIVDVEEKVKFFMNYEELLGELENLLSYIENEALGTQHPCVTAVIAIRDWNKLHHKCVLYSCKQAKSREELMLRITQDADFERFVQQREIASTAPEGTPNCLIDRIAFPVELIPTILEFLENVFDNAIPGSLLYNALTEGIKKLTDIKIMIRERLQEYEERSLVNPVRATMRFKKAEWEEYLGLDDPERRLLLSGIVRGCQDRRFETYLFDNALVFGIRTKNEDTGASEIFVEYPPFALDKVAVMDPIDKPQDGAHTLDVHCLRSDRAFPIYFESEVLKDQWREGILNACRKFEFPDDDKQDTTSVNGKRHTNTRITANLNAHRKKVKKLLRHISKKSPSKETNRLSAGTLEAELESLRMQQMALFNQYQKTQLANNGLESKTGMKDTSKMLKDMENINTHIKSLNSQLKQMRGSANGTGSGGDEGGDYDSQSQYSQSEDGESINSDNFITPEQQRKFQKAFNLSKSEKFLYEYHCSIGGSGSLYIGAKIVYFKPKKIISIVQKMKIPFSNIVGLTSDGKNGIIMSLLSGHNHLNQVLQNMHIDQSKVKKITLNGFVNEEMFNSCYQVLKTMWIETQEEASASGVDA
eukprot:Nk52_evm8s217 gene=Nk52_evmTU8s217